MEPWPLTPEELRMAQESLAAESPPPWRPAGRGWARSVAAWLVDGRPVASAVVDGPAGAAYEPGLLALREGPLLEEALLRVLGAAEEPVGLPEVLIVNATGRDHPRRAGLALHLGALLGNELVHLGVDGHAQGIGHQDDALLESDMARRGTGNRKIRGARRGKFLTNHRVRL